MPHLKSAAKRLRQSRKREIGNKKIKNQIERLVKKARSAKNLSTIYKAIDKVVKRKIFHPNKAARMKQMLSKRLAAK